jgi:phage tail-like protein
MIDDDPVAENNLRPPGVAIAHVVDFYRRYPGDTVTLLTRVDVNEPLAGFTLRIALPDGLIPGATKASANHDGSLPHVVFVEGARYLIWTLNQDVPDGARFEYQLEATVMPTEHDQALSSRAVVMVNRRSDDARPPFFQAETVTMAVSAHGRLLKYLPALYTEQDEMMGRFLMLFESFWNPIEDRIDNIHYYFDPRLTPGDLLPWLATWVDLVLDEQWPDEKRRQLLSAMVPLYRQRGTRRGLQAYLAIYTGQQAQIKEHRAHNFVLGQISRLGPAAALGKHNISHTFDVSLQLPPAANEDKRRERRRKIEAIIESEKPAHTAYTLIIEEIT